MYDRYKELCKQQDMIVKDKTIFAKYFYQVFPSVTSRRLGSGANQQSCYCGVSAIPPGAQPVSAAVGGEGYERIKQERERETENDSGKEEKREKGESEHARKRKRASGGEGEKVTPPNKMRTRSQTKKEEHSDKFNPTVQSHQDEGRTSGYHNDRSTDLGNLRTKIPELIQSKKSPPPPLQTRALQDDRFHPMAASQLLLLHQYLSSGETKYDAELQKYCPLLAVDRYFIIVLTLHFQIPAGLCV